MKKKNGFTLVELLIVIALMLSILGISVVSFITISNKKKEDAWEEVKSQIEVAARQYFSSNEYLFEGLGENLVGTISVGTLVDNDYLNVVTNPKTGKLISKCSVVNITKNGSKYDTKFHDESITSTDSSCDSHYILISESGGPSIKAIVKGTKGNGQWYTSSATVNNYVDDNNNGEIKNVGIYDEESQQIIKELTLDNNSKNVFSDFDTYRNDIIITRKCYAAENENGKKAYACIELGVDTTPPTVTVNTENENWTNQDVYYTYSASDNMNLNSLVGYWNANNKNESDANANDCSWNESSKSYGNDDCKGNNGSNKISVSAKEYTQTGYFSAQGYRKIKFKACDEAGNCSYSNEAIARIDKTDPIDLRVTLKKCDYDYNNEKLINCNDNYSNGTWINKYVNTSFTVSDSLSGVDYSAYKTTGETTNNNYDSTINRYSRGIVAEGTSYITYKACDKAGNCAFSSTNTIKLDRTKPKIKSFEVKSMNKNYNSNKVTFSWNIDDTKYNNNNKSDIAVSGIKKVTTNGIYNKDNNDTWYKNGDVTWNYDGKISFTISNSLDCKNYTPKLTVTDVAGNSSSEYADNYKVFCYATSCDATKVYASDTACSSGKNDDISARLKIKCNGKIDYVELKYYYPGAEYSTCNGNSKTNAVCKHYPGGKDECNNDIKATSDINGAVFNLRGCGVQMITYKYKVVANGKIIHNFDDDDWKTYNFTTSTGASKLCEPKAGSYWFE